MNLRLFHAFLILLSAALAVVFGFWCLALYFLCRQRVRVQQGGKVSGRSPLFPATDAKSVEPVPWPLLGSLRAGWRILRCGPWTPRGTRDLP